MLTKRYGCASEQAHLRHFQSVSETVGFYIRPVQKLDEPSVYLNDSCSLSVAQRKEPCQSRLLIYQVRCNFSYIAWESEEVYHILPQVHKFRRICEIYNIRISYCWI